MNNSNNKEEFQVVNEEAQPEAPVVGALISLGRQGYEFWQAVSELIDNTITIDGNTDVTLTLDTTKRTFRIKDDSIGIPGKDLMKVLATGYKVNKGKQLMSKSGMGMKAAIYWMGKDFELTTKSITEKNDWVYKIIPNFTSDSDPEVKQTYTVTKWKDKNAKPGTTLLIKNLKTFPKTKAMMDWMCTNLACTYKRGLSQKNDEKLNIRFIGVQANDVYMKSKIESINPLLSDFNKILDPQLKVGANRWSATGTLKGDAGNGWEVKVSAGRKLHPKAAWAYYEKRNLSKVSDVYGTLGGRKGKASPYDYRADTSGINFILKGKVLVFNQKTPTSRAESLCVDVDIIKGIEPSMIKTGMNTSTEEYKEMMGKLKKWMIDKGFQKRTKANTQHLGENEDVRDKFIEVIRNDELKRAEWGISLDTFDQQVIPEMTTEIGRIDIFVNGDNKKIVIEAKKEEIDAKAISQAVGYALQVDADMILVIAQQLTKSGVVAQKMWQKHFKKYGLEKEIVFQNILTFYV